MNLSQFERDTVREGAKIARDVMLRDQIAMMILNAVITKEGLPYSKISVAYECYALADVMISMGKEGVV